MVVGVVVGVVAVKMTVVVVVKVVVRGEVGEEVEMMTGVTVVEVVRAVRSAGARTASAPQLTRWVPLAATEMKAAATMAGEVRTAWKKRRHHRLPRHQLSEKPPSTRPQAP